MVEACGATNVTIASFRDTAEVILGPQDKAYSAADPLIIRKPLHTAARNDVGGAGLAYTGLGAAACPCWRGSCEERMTRGRTSRNETDMGIELTMLDGDQADQMADERVAEDAGSSCTALVPVVPAAPWSRSRPHPRPSSIFVTHLIATAEQAPQTRGLRRASASDANAAYTSSRQRIAGAGLKARRIV